MFLEDFHLKVPPQVSDLPLKVPLHLTSFSLEWFLDRQVNGHGTFLRSRDLMFDLVYVCLCLRILTYVDI